MPYLTNLQIVHAIKRVAQTAKQENLVDGEGRGTGRLLLCIKLMPSRVTTDWMAQQYRDGKRVKRKIGTYPTMTLAEAREVFSRDYAKVIEKGQSIKIAMDSRAGSVEDLFAGYVSHLKEANKTSWSQIEYTLGKVAVLLGPKRPARDIEAEDIIAAIRPIYLRGKRSMADHVRSHVRSAYSWGLKSEHDYRSTSPRRFHLKGNPAATIPTEPKVVGSRWLNEDEFVRLFRWLECPDTPVHPPYTRATRVIMLTGQRVEEIARLHISQWDSAERIIDWSKTKNNRPHAIPVPPLAAELLDDIIPNEFGWLFPSQFDPSRPVTAGTLYSFTWRQRERGVIPYASNRDLRRTWKTLAGKAGISKEIRDRIQNHALQDVSSKNYDRWTYMPEKRKAMDVWNAFVVDMLKQPPQSPMEPLDQEPSPNMVQLIDFDEARSRLR